MGAIIAPKEHHQLLIKNTTLLFNLFRIFSRYFRHCNPFFLGHIEGVIVLKYCVTMPSIYNYLVAVSNHVEKGSTLR